MKRIREIADKYNLKIVEDAAHCIDGQRDGIRPGQLSDLACFSFYTTKAITSGEGGAVVSNNEELVNKIRLLRSHGMSKEATNRYLGNFEHWDALALGWKYAMSNIQAALLIDQLDNIEQYRQRREQICRMYEEGFKDNPNIVCLQVLPNSRSSRQMMTILVPPGDRDTILQSLKKKEIGVAVNYRAIHLLSYLRHAYRYKRGAFPVAEQIGDSTITLPVYPKLSDTEIHYVIDAINEVTINKHMAC
jgi:dTDP-4-amino-4,6-dideoxygalactose transaminase